MSRVSLQHSIPACGFANRLTSCYSAGGLHCGRGQKGTKQIAKTEGGTAADPRLLVTLFPLVI